jgi:hypothetical protein
MMLETVQIQMKWKKRTNVAILEQKQLMMRLTLLMMKGGKSPKAFMYEKVSQRTTTRN